MYSDACVRLRELKTMIVEASGHTKTELDAMGSNNLVSGILSLASVVTFLGTAYLFSLIPIWVPASFLILSGWVLISTFDLERRVLNFSKKYDYYLKEFKKTPPDKMNYALFTVSRNSDPLSKSMGAIFGVSLILILLIGGGLLNGAKSSNLVWADLIALFFFLCYYLGSGRLTRQSKSGDLTRRFDDMADRHPSKMPYPTAILAGGAVFGLFVFSLAMYGLSATLPLADGYSRLSVVVGWELLAILFLTSYLSYQNARSELSRSLTIFARLDGAIGDDILQGRCSNEVFEKRRAEYGQAKQYNVQAKSVLFLNFYSLLLEPTYLKRLGQADEPTHPPDYIG